LDAAGRLCRTLKPGPGRWRWRRHHARFRRSEERGGKTIVPAVHLSRRCRNELALKDFRVALGMELDFKPRTASRDEREDSAQNRRRARCARVFRPVGTLARRRKFSSGTIGTKSGCAGVPAPGCPGGSAVPHRQAIIGDGRPPQAYGAEQYPGTQGRNEVLDGCGTSSCQVAAGASRRDACVVGPVAE